MLQQPEAGRRLASGNEAVALAALHAGVAPGHGLPRHAVDRDPRGLRRAGRPGPVGAQREGRARGRHRRRLRRRARPGDDEARRAERGRRSAVHGGVHGRERRPGHRVGRRSRHGLAPERAGQPPLRRGRRRADARAGGFAGGLRLHPARLRALRALAHPGAAAHDHARLPLDDGARNARLSRAARARRWRSSATSPAA